MKQKGNPQIQISLQDSCLQQKKIDLEIVKEYWTEHRITLIAYEAQYIYSQKQILMITTDRDDINEKNNGKKVNPQYESGFLSISLEENKEINTEKLVKDYFYLNWLFYEIKDEDYLEIKQFIKIMLQLKHSCIFRQFCEIYNLIVNNLKLIEFPMIEKEESRFKLLEDIRNKIVVFIEQNKEKFKYFSNYFQRNEKQTKKLILVEIYCIVAQKFNFNINQFYSEAFSITIQTKSQKKVKRS